MKRARSLFALCVVVALVCAGCATSETPDVFRARGPQGRDSRFEAAILFVLGGAVAVVVIALILYAALGRRHREVGPRGDSRFIVIGGVVLPALVLAVVGYVTVDYANRIRPAASASDALVVKVTGHDWWWEVEYPSLGVRTANEVHVPAGRDVVIELTSADVIHSFWVPQLGGKLDAIPGSVNRLPLRADVPGDVWGQCAEFCGLQHAKMRFVVHVDAPGEFDTWAASHAQPSGTAATNTESDPNIERGRAVFFTQPCSGCHRIAGTEAVGTIGPDLSDLGSRTTVGAGALPNDPASLAAWITDPSASKPGVRMPGFALSPDDLQALVAYLESNR